jgi:serine/threonine-protein kinase
MGEVYLAVDPASGRKVAIKVIAASAHLPAELARFANEAGIHSGLRHPNIAELYECRHWDGRPCLVMEYVDGHTLADRLRLQGSIPWPEALEILRGAASAVEYLHSNAILHRDIKSSNVKLSSSGAVKLLDFGIARRIDGPRLTQTGSVIGTLENLAPEQIRHSTATVRSDVWALGVLLYEMLTGVLPFQAEAIGELYERIVRQSVSPPSHLNPAVPPHVDALVLDCLRKRPEDRIANCEILRERIDAALRQNSPWATLAARLRANPVPAAAAATFLVLFAAVLLTAPPPRATTSPPTPAASPTPATPVTFEAAPPDAPVRLRPAPAPLPGPAAELLPPPPSHTPAPAPPAERPAPEYAAPPPPRGQDLRSVVIDSIGGPSDVYQNGYRVGSTPFTVRAERGARLEFLLRRPGHRDLPVVFEVSEREAYSYALTPQ